MRIGAGPVPKPGVPTAAVAACGLPGLAPWPAAPLPPEAWNRLMQEVARERIEGLLAAAVASGGLVVDRDQRQEARSAAWGRARVDLGLERQLIATARVLDQAGVCYRVLKGLAWAHTTYPDPSWRGAGDVDLLVANDDWYRAVRALESDGACRVLPEVHPGFDRRFGKDATLRSRGGWELDLHRLLVAGPFGLWVDQAQLLARSARTTIGGSVLPVLDAEAAFVHACYNLVLADDPPRLIAARDVAQMVVADRADPEGVHDLARRWRAVPVLVRALSLAERMLSVRLWNQPLARPFLPAGIGPVARVLMAMYRGPGRGYSSQAAAVIALSGPVDRLAYLDALARPQRAYLEARGLSRAGHLRRGIRRTWGRA
jgi:hypothetical protein